MSPSPAQPRADTSAVWTYWDDAPGTQRSAYLRLCEQTQRRHAGDLPVHLVSLDDVHEWLPDLRPEVRDLQLAHRADYIRVRLLHRYGGVWFDADTIALRPVPDLLDLLEPDDEFLGFTNDGVHVGAFAAPARSRVLAEWADAQDEVIDHATDLSRLDWDDLGWAALQPILERHRWRTIDHRRIAPIGWRDWELFLSVTCPAVPLLRPDPFAICLYNSRLDRVLSAFSTDDVRNGHLLVSRLLRVGLGDVDPEQADGWRCRFDRAGSFRRRWTRRREIRARDAGLRRRR